MTLKEVASAVYTQMGRIPRDQREDLTASETYDPYLGTACSSTHLAMVEVDTETFGVKIHRYVVAEDCGKIINPMIVDGQVHGAVAQGIGAALLEEIIHDDQGQAVAASLADYLVPVASSVPEIGIVHIEADLPNNIGGFRGMGEGGTIGAPAAIANAVSDALAHLGCPWRRSQSRPNASSRCSARDARLPQKRQICRSRIQTAIGRTDI